MNWKSVLLTVLVSLLVISCSNTSNAPLPDVEETEAEGGQNLENVIAEKNKADELIRKEEVEAAAEFTFSLPFKMVNEKVGYVQHYSYREDDVYYHDLYKTTDGGVTWYPILKDIANIVKLYIFDQDSLWIVLHGESVPIYVEGIDYALESEETYHIIKSTDGGESWKEATPINLIQSYKGGFNALHFIDQHVGYAAVVYAAGNGYAIQELFKTEDGGGNWTYKGPIDCNGNTGSLLFKDDSIGWFSSFTNSLKLCQTNDGGETWNEQALPIPLDFNEEHFASISNPYFFNDDEGILSVSYSNYLDIKHRLVFYRTRDGGETWKIEDNFLELEEANNNTTASEYPESVQYVESGTGWVLTNKNRLFRFDSHVGEWLQIHDAASVMGYPKRNQMLNQLQFVSADIGWVIAGTHERKWLFQTIDGGESWQAIDVEIVK